MLYHQVGLCYQICVRDGPPSWMVATRMRQSRAQGRRFPFILMISRAFVLHLVLDDRCLFADGALYQICIRDGPPSWMVATRMRHVKSSGETISVHSDDFPRFFLTIGP